MSDAIRRRLLSNNAKGGGQIDMRNPMQSAQRMYRQRQSPTVESRSYPSSPFAGNQRPENPLAPRFADQMLQSQGPPASTMRRPDITQVPQGYWQGFAGRRETPPPDLFNIQQQLFGFPDNPVTRFVGKGARDLYDDFLEVWGLGGRG